MYYWDNPNFRAWNTVAEEWSNEPMHEHDANNWQSNKYNHMTNNYIINFLLSYVFDKN